MRNIIDTTELIKRFEEFTNKRLIVGTRALDREHRDLNGAYKDMKEAEILASEILKTLKTRLSKIET